MKILKTLWETIRMYVIYEYEFGDEPEVVLLGDKKFLKAARSDGKKKIEDR